MNLSSMIILGICAMLTLSFGVILFVTLYQRRVISHQIELKKINEQKEIELIQASIQGEERERGRIASELHDDVNATLSAVRLFLHKEKNTSYDDNAIARSKALLDESINKIRDISHNLHPTSLQYAGLETALCILAEKTNAAGVMGVRYTSINTLLSAHESIQLGAYRISQELLNNITKHSAATSVMISSYTESNEIVICFEHDGIGLTQETYERNIYKSGAIGLKNIVNRLKSMDATLIFSECENIYQTILKISLTREGGI
jgi:two-component system NarL family sensor kinase